MHHLDQGWTITLTWGHFEKAAFSREPYILMEIEASLSSS